MDAHGAYTAEGAVHVGRVYWLEDPLPPEDVDGYVHLTATLEMAVAAGETECTRWQFEERLSRRAATVASLPNTRWAPHVSMGSSIHVAAAAHLAAASANFLIFEFSSTPNPIGEDLLTTPTTSTRRHCATATQRPRPVSLLADAV